ncbi:MAG: TolC family protein, partial [Bacteroidales bacterium]|nr:TolC family protein [Bacteroidales bacterium]MDY5448325.1 TolC family protein [Prevotella sp.]
LNVANIQKGWLPQVSASAQATLQSDVPAFPDEFQKLYQQMGITMEGLERDQYRVGFDVQQTVYDGGSIKSQKEIARRQGELHSRQNEVTMYNVRRRVNEMYFSLLLINEQIRLNADLQTVLEGNEKKLAAMLKGGTASESDWQNVKAERLNVVQQMTGLKSQRTVLKRMLSTFCAMEVNRLVKPEILENTGSTVNLRPELKTIDAQLRLADAKEKALDATLMPRLGVFAQGYYGYPGYNMFEDMTGRKLSWNGIIGARLTWNIGALYSRKNDKAKLQAERETAEANRERFLLDNKMEQIQQNENISRYRQLMTDDEEIISLRSSIRKAAESKLAHGIIDVNDLVREINSENKARVEQCIHEIEMLKEIYDLKITTGE